MNSMEIWKLLIDVGLMASLVFLCYRFARPDASPSNNRSEKLESSLSHLIKEAEQASYELDEKLLGRQKKLQRLLLDLEAIEERANRALTKAEKLETGSQISAGRDDERSSSSAVYSTTPQETELYERRKAAEGYSSRQPNIHRPITTMQEEEHEDEAAQEYIPQSGKNVNIYGEPIAAARSPEPRKTAPVKQNIRPRITRPNSKNKNNYYKPLSASVEKEVSYAENSRDDSDVNASLQEIYSAAEQMLKAGKDVSFICEHTQLPVDEVKMLSQILERENGMQAPENERARVEDPRLGVLGGIKRDVQVL